MLAVISLGLANILVLLRVVILWDHNVVRRKFTQPRVYNILTVLSGRKETDIGWICRDFLRDLYVHDDHMCRIIWWV